MVESNNKLNLETINELMSLYQYEVWRRNIPIRGPLLKLKLDDHFN